MRLKHRWSVVAVYVAAIYLTIPFAGQAWLRLSSTVHLPPSTLSIVILSTAAIAVLASLLRGNRLNRSTLVGLFLLAAVYAYLLRHAFVEAIERIHLIEYGALPWLIWWAMGADVTVQNFAVVWVLAADLGVFDELIQHYTPGRFGELRDVMINWESSALGLGILGIFTKRQ